MNIPLKELNRRLNAARTMRDEFPLNSTEYAFYSGMTEAYLNLIFSFFPE